MMHTAVQPPPAPPAEDMDEPTSVILMPRPKTRVGPATAAPSDPARQARALAMALEAIVIFLGSSPTSHHAADAMKALARDLAAAGPPADLVDALRGLAARLSAAANELT